GVFGYFPTYALGTMIAAQLWEAAHVAIPDLERRIADGDLTTLREWLREHVHRHGRTRTGEQILRPTLLQKAGFVNHIVPVPGQIGHETVERRHERLDAAHTPLRFVRGQHRTQRVHPGVPPRAWHPGLNEGRRRRFPRAARTVEDKNAPGHRAAGYPLAFGSSKMLNLRA
ncbi:hypothetical protein EON79_23625, partial [bacterium]